LSDQPYAGSSYPDGNIDFAVAVVIVLHGFVRSQLPGDLLKRAVRALNVYPIVAAPDGVVRLAVAVVVSRNRGIAAFSTLSPAASVEITTLCTVEIKYTVVPTL